MNYLKRNIIALCLVFTASNVMATDVKEFVDLSKCDKIIDKKVFNICYDYSHKSAKAVYYPLDGDLVNAVNLVTDIKFYEESELPFFKSVSSTDYLHSGYDRGHLCPDADMDYSFETVYLPYSMANVIPMTPSLNRKVWLKSEKYERLVATKLGNVNVINIVNYSSDPIKMNHKIDIPNKFYKIIYNDEKNFKKCFTFDNIEYMNVEQDRLEDHEIECSKLKI